ncbi:Atrazine chlorohydrolase [Pirellula sp. SH-Sr6A]|uniref:amidohydrolase family protein n=1 Tax=Pirellula sp. SH-Sr6A TaxID=1632865 RepID=UPI00078B4532|nr:amidohydrolase family protein [Pirellula sp. SH-Sr6A]AMV30697.1 Atrazine chlorohydrolase [Pirellula sp. SH-Sr6A]
MKRKGLVLIAAWGFTFACQVTGLLADTLAIKGGTILTVSAGRMEDGTILIRDGKIESVGKDVPVPIEATVIDAKGKVVIPGFVEAHTSEGMGQSNERNDFVPFLSVVDSIDPVLDFFEESRRNGVTTIAIVPGNSTLVGGRSAILKTAGQYVDDMIVRRDAGVKVAMQPTNGSRMGHLARLRKELDKAKQSLEKRSKGELDSKESAKPESGEKKQDDAPKPDGNGADASQPENNAASEALYASKGLDVMMDVVAGKTPVFLYCDSAMDVANGKQLAKDYSLDCIFVLGRTAYKAVDLLKDAKHPVVLDKSLVFWESEPRTRMESKVVLPKVFLDAKVPFVFQTGDGGFRTTIGSSYLWYQAAVAVKAGMSEEAALRALTLTPAELLGVSELVGSIEAGKDADLVILSGKPLRTATWVEKTIVNGKVVYDRSNDDKLKRLLSPKAE